MRSNCWIFSLHTGNSGSIVQQIKTQFLPVNYRAVLTELVRIKIHSNTITSLIRSSQVWPDLTSNYQHSTSQPGQAKLENKPTSQWWQIFFLGREGGEGRRGPTFSHWALVLISYKKTSQRSGQLKTKLPAKTTAATLLTTVFIDFSHHKILLFSLKDYDSPPPVISVSDILSNLTLW